MFIIVGMLSLWLFSSKYDKQNNQNQSLISFVFFGFIYTLASCPSCTVRFINLSDINKNQWKFKSGHPIMGKLSP